MSDVAVSSFLGSLPPHELAIGYGSAVFPQATAKQGGGGDTSPGMIDLLLCVDDPAQFHSANFDTNKDHYSWFTMLPRGLALKAICQLQQMSPGLFYNTMVPLRDNPTIQFKYGVISTADLLTDLRCWNTLYASGRLHKPVKIFKPAEFQALEDALKQNLHSAAVAALLMLPQQFTEFDLYTQIAGLSYTGDIRMGVAENPHKVRNIVKGSLGHFTRLYRPVISTLQAQGVGLVSHGEGGADGELLLTQQTASSDVLAELTSRLPQPLQKELLAGAPHQFQTQEALSAAAWRRAFKQWDLPRRRAIDITRTFLSRTVRGSSWRQTLKGIVTAGPAKSARYAVRKLGKRFSLRLPR